MDLGHKSAMGLTLAAILLGGCNAAPNRTHTDQRDACALLTKAEVDSILQTSVTLAADTGQGNSSCHYQPTAGNNGFSLTVYWTGGKEQLGSVKSGMRIAPKLTRQGGMDPGAMMALESVGNLGDEAYFNPIAGSYVLRGDVLMEYDLRLFLFHTPSEEAAISAWRALAERALSRL